jgi:hypothetical protein
VERIKEEKIPDNIAYVACTRLLHHVPLQLAKLAAGIHQRGQNESMPCNTEDVVSQLVVVMHKKYDRNVSPTSMTMA